MQQTQQAGRQPVGQNYVRSLFDKIKKGNVAEILN
jgi:hypothetical protein